MKVCRKQAELGRARRPHPNQPAFAPAAARSAQILWSLPRPSRKAPESDRNAAQLRAKPTPSWAEGSRVWSEGGVIPGLAGLRSNIVSQSAQTSPSAAHVWAKYPAHTLSNLSALGRIRLHFGGSNLLEDSPQLPISAQIWSTLAPMCCGSQTTVGSGRSAQDRQRIGFGPQFARVDLRGRVKLGCVISGCARRASKALPGPIVRRKRQTHTATHRSGKHRQNSAARRSRSETKMSTIPLRSGVGKRLRSAAG